MTLLELLTTGRIEEFNARRGQRVALDFFAADLGGLRLAGADLSGANLEKADLTGADLSGAILAKANLSGADLTDAVLDRCVAVRARFREAYLGNARAVEAEFSGADFGEADLSGFVAEGCRFSGARFREAVLANARLARADFTEARFTGADLRGADFTGANLHGAELARANAAGTCFVQANLTAAKMAAGVFKRAQFGESNLTAADLSAADLTDADLAKAKLEGADLFDVQADPETLAAATRSAGLAEGPVAVAGADVELHFEDPCVALSDGHVGVLWENADSDDALTLRWIQTRTPKAVATGSIALAVPVERLLARALLATPSGFTCVLFIERPAGVEMAVVPIERGGGLGTARTVRLGYMPVVKPVLVPDSSGFFVYGISRQGALSVHQFDGTELRERLRAPAGTYRGFCGRLDPILLGKGGTVAPVSADGIGTLLSAPPGYPGRLTAAASQPETDQIALAWVPKGERGIRFQVLGADPEATRVDAAAEVGAIDLRAVGNRWLLVYTREPSETEDRTTPMAVWFDADGKREEAKPFPLLTGKDRVDIEEIRLLQSEAAHVALVTLGEDLMVAEVQRDSAQVRARFGSFAIG